jgi:hypothetical protein
MLIDAPNFPEIEPLAILEDENLSTASAKERTLSTFRDNFLAITTSLEYSLK